jgi:hypothetical protein
MAGAAVLFAAGRHISNSAIDFQVYYHAARSLIAGRTDLYSETFAWGFPQTYVYPPLFVLLVFPVGWLSYANAAGLWLAMMVLATLAVIKQTGVLGGGWKNAGRYLWVIIALAGPYLLLTLRYGNVQLFVVLLEVYAVLAWSHGRRWASCFALALGGAVKLFPLLLTPVFLARREWGMAGRVAAISCLLWAFPALYFGPGKTASLYRSWYDVVVRDLRGYESQRAMDASLEGAAERWLTRVDYAGHWDRNYPPVNFAKLPPWALEVIRLLVGIVILAATLWVCARLRRPVRDPAGSGGNSQDAAVLVSGCLAVTAQLLLGPHSPLVYFSGWLLVGTALPAAFPPRGRFWGALLTLATLNLLLFAVPGAANQRALQASGAFTLVGLALWAFTLYVGWALSKWGASPAEDPAQFG